MRRSSMTLLAGITAALTIGAAAPALAVDRFCTQWQYIGTYNPATHSYVFSRGNCLHWAVIIPRVPWPPFLDFGSAQTPGDPTPWISEREFKASQKGRRQALNPQPLPPVAQKPI